MLTRQDTQTAEVVDDGVCPDCNGVGTDGGHRCTSYECCGPCKTCDGTGYIQTICPPHQGDPCVYCGEKTEVAS